MCPSRFLSLFKFQIICSEETNLSSNQKEADTKVFLCTKHAESFGFQSVVIVTVDTDIAVYSIYFQQFLEAELFVKISNGKDKRLLKIVNISSKLGKDLCAALPALHCFTGNDDTSAFYGIGKTRAFKAIQRNEDFINIFKSFVDTFLFNSKLFAMVEKLVCQLYAAKTKNVNEGCYLKFYGKKKTLEPQDLPLTADSLLCHYKHVSYATAIIKQSLVSNPVIPSLGKVWLVHREWLSRNSMDASSTSSR